MTTTITVNSNEVSSYTSFRASSATLAWLADDLTLVSSYGGYAPMIRYATYVEMAAYARTESQLSTVYGTERDEMQISVVILLDDVKQGRRMFNRYMGDYVFRSTR